MIELNENEAMISWLCVVKMYENYEKLETFETDEEQDKTNRAFKEELRQLANKLHETAFPQLHEFASEGKMDINKLLL
jgi:hypothetical protein